MRQILNTASEIIKKEGIDHLNMLVLSKASKTSTGSLYHFFPDRFAVINALREYHNQHIQQFICEMEKNTPAQLWKSLSAGKFIENFLFPYAKYISTHRDYLPVMQQTGFNFENSRFLSFFSGVMRLRQPDWTDNEIAFEVNFIHSVMIGTLRQSFQYHDELAYDFLPKLIDLLTLYLKNRETASGAVT